MKEFNLSDEIFGEDHHCEIKVIPVDKVIESIRILKEIWVLEFVSKEREFDRSGYNKEIDEIFGDKLI